MVGGLLGALTLVVACDKSDDPDAVTLKDLKYPNHLSIQDQGNGTIRLTWRGSNFEDDFDGYNIFGAKGTAGELGLMEGQALQLLDGDGNAIAGAKDVLQGMSYNGQDLETTADKPKVEGKYSFYPVYSLDDDKKPVLPTCSPRADGVCQSPQATGDMVTPFSGTTSYTISGLETGASYCFLVFTSQDEGEEVSQTSSPAVCVVPKLKMDLAVQADSGVTGQKSMGLKLVDVLATCVAGDCPDLGTFDADSSYWQGSNTVATASSDLPLYIEDISGELWFTTGADAVMSDLGYLASGFDDAQLPAGVQVPALASATLSSLANPRGFSVPGQSLRMEKHHMYLLAMVEDGQVRYHWLWVHGTPVVGESVAVEVRLGAQAVDPASASQNL